MASHDILDILPQDLSAEIKTTVFLPDIREIRLRSGRETEIILSESCRMLCYKSTEDDFRRILEFVSKYSLYRITDQLQNGFCTARNGCRIGVGGNLVSDETGDFCFERITSVNLRFAREIYGCADKLISVLRKTQDSTLILGAPGCGKTTLLRDLIRQVSDTMQMRVSVSDERYELGGTNDGTLDLGKRTDILSGGNRYTTMMMLLRTMSPQWLAVDEITSVADVEAIEKCAYCGVKLLATAHADSADDLFRRPVYRNLMDRHIFGLFAEMKSDASYTVRREAELFG